jgi:hypothetical protein
MKKWLAIPILILVFAPLLLYWQFNYPSDEVIKREFLAERPNVEVVYIELIFDWEPKRILSYLIKYKEPQSDEIKMDEFAIQQEWNFQWRWCNDQTNRKCK